MRHYRKKLKKI